MIYKRILSLLLVMLLMIGIPLNIFAMEVTETDPTAPMEPTEPVGEEMVELQADYVFVEDPGEYAVSMMADVYATLGTMSALDLIPKNAITLSYTDAQGSSHYTQISRISWHYVDTADNIIICLEPDKSCSNGSGNSGDNNIGLEGDSDTIGTNAWYKLTFNQRRAIGLVLLYGCPNGYWNSSAGVSTSGINPNKGYRAATQAIVWEIVAGLRSAVAPYGYTSAGNAATFWDQCSGVVVGSDGTDYFQACYNHIVNSMAAHGTVPSFTSKASASAPTIEMTGTSKTVTDTNRVLSRFAFTNTSDVTFSKSGNNLTIQTNGTLTNTSFTAYAQAPNPESSVYQLWYNGYTSEYQTLIKLYQVQSDPVPAYFKLKAATGSLSLTKTTEDGKNLSGWQFGIYSDAACSTLVSGPHTTDTSGKISVTGLSAGTVYVKELGHNSSTINALYKCTSTNPQKVTISSGQTASVTFNNDLVRGYAKLIKQTNTGKNVAGWKINLYSDSACTKLVSGSPFVTGSDGTITAELLPGDYWCREVDESSIYPDWFFDTNAKKVTVKAGQTASVIFSNTQLGRGKLIKSMPDGGSVAGWVFDVYRKSDGAHMGTFTSGTDGSILTGYLYPGDYEVYEQIPEDGIYYCESENPQTVTITAGGTAAVTFVNRIKPAQIVVYKVDSMGAPLAEAEFLLEWSEDGTAWAPVTYSDSAYVSKGTCSSVGLENGRLESGRDGVVCFEGLHPELQYRLTEIKAPAGHQLLTGPAYEGGIPTGETLVVELTVVNAPVYELPMTGSTGSTIQRCLQIVGVLVLLITLLYITKKRR